MLQESVDEGDELQKILFKVNRGIEDRRIDENNFKQIHAEVFKIKRELLAGRGKRFPKEILNYVNTLKYIGGLTGGEPVCALIGGMHLLRASEQRMSETIAYLRNLRIKYLCAGHCTGADAIHELNNAFPEQSEYLFVGREFSFESDPGFSLDI